MDLITGILIIGAIIIALIVFGIVVSALLARKGMNDFKDIWDDEL